MFLVSKKSSPTLSTRLLLRYLDLGLKSCSSCWAGSSVEWSNPALVNYLLIITVQVLWWSMYSPWSSAPSSTYILVRFFNRLTSRSCTSSKLLTCLNSVEPIMNIWTSLLKITFNIRVIITLHIIIFFKLRINLMISNNFRIWCILIRIYNFLTILNCAPLQPWSSILLLRRSLDLTTVLDYCLRRLSQNLRRCILW